jgi:hypothetical protein
LSSSNEDSILSEVFIEELEFELEVLEFELLSSSLV